MADIATLGFRAPTGELVEAEKALDRLPAAAGRAERASTKLGLTLDKVDSAAGALQAAAMALTGAIDRVAAASTAQAGAVDRAATATTSNAAAVTKAATATDKLSTSTRRTTKDVDGLTAKLRAQQAVMSAPGGFNFARDRGADIAAYGDQLDNLRGKYNPLFAVIRQYRANVDEIRQANRVGAISVDEMTAALSRQRQAALLAISSIKGTGTAAVGTSAALAGAGGQLKLRTDEMLNLSRQAADVGVTLAMGMSPLMVAIQQGPQIADIFASASQRGIGFSAVLRQIGASAMAALMPILPILLPIIAAITAISVGFSLGAREINKSSGDIAAGLNLTEKQMERLKQSGVETTVTLSDTFRAFFQVLGERIEWLLSGPIQTLSSGWNTAMDGITSSGGAAIKDVVGTFAGGYAAIVALWKNMPRTFAGIGALVANAFIAAFEGLVNRIIGEVNGINSKINAALTAVGLGGTQLVKLDNIKIGRIQNSEALAAADAIGTAYEQGYARAGKAVDRFFADVGNRARKNRTALVKEAAGDAEALKKEREKKEKEREQLYMKLADMNYDVTDEFRTPQIDIDALAQSSPIVDRWFADYMAGMENARDTTRSFIEDLRQGLRNGENLFKTFGNAIMNVVDRVVDKLLDVAVDGLFQPGSGIGGFLSSVLGGLGGGGKSLSGFRPDFTPTASPLVLTAKGAAFGNQGIVSTPTLYGISGGGAGVMGEEDPEAVMPLTRGSDGSLGVQMYGGGTGGGTVINAPISVHNDNRVSGAVSSAEIVELQRRSAEQTKREIERSLPAIIEQHREDGAYV